MTVDEAEEKFNSLKAEAKEIAAGLKEWNKRYKKLAKKAVSLYRKIDLDKKLYLDDGSGPDGWDIRSLFCLGDFDDYKDPVGAAMILCENLAKWKFRKGKGS